MTEHYNPSNQLTSTTVFQLLLTALAPILWGTTYIVTTEMLPPDRPMMAALLRVLPAGILLLIFSRQMPAADAHIWKKLFALSFLNITCFQVLLFVAAYRLPGGIAAVISSFQPLIIVFLLFFLDAIKPSKITVTAILFSIVGMALLLVKKDAQWDMVGIIAAFLGAISMASGIYLTKKWQTRMSNIALTGWQLFLGGLMIAPVAFYYETLPTHLSIINLLGYAYLALFGSLIAYYLFFRGIKALPAIAVSILGA